jgi:hypothetical protein
VPLTEAFAESRARRLVERRGFTQMEQQAVCGRILATSAAALAWHGLDGVYCSGLEASILARLGHCGAGCRHFRRRRLTTTDRGEYIALLDVVCGEPISDVLDVMCRTRHFSHVGDYSPSWFILAPTQCRLPLDQAVLMIS